MQDYHGGSISYKDRPELGWVTVERNEKGHFVLDLLGELPNKEDEVMAELPSDSESGTPDGSSNEDDDDCASLATSEDEPDILVLETDFDPQIKALQESFVRTEPSAPARPRRDTSDARPVGLRAARHPQPDGRLASNSRVGSLRGLWPPLG